MISEPRRARPDARVLAWFRGVDPGALYVSVLSLGEARDGIERLRLRGDDRQADVIEGWLEDLKNSFAERLIDVSPAVAERWGRLSAVRPLPVIDALLAATAIEHDLTLVTRDTADLADTGVRLLNPWG